jgi:CheY-like chemotaxis protein
MDASHKPTALLVDDEALSRKAEQARLEGEGYMVFAASGATEALAQARQTAPNVIFVHVVSAGGNLPLIQALRSDDACRHIPIVVVRKGTDVRIASTKLKTVPRDGW